MWKARLDHSETYVLDLVQQPDGRRRLEPRPAGHPPTPYAVLVSKPYRGGDLMRRREYGQVAESVELDDGRRFVLDSHGIWLLPEEAEYLFGRRPSAGERPPWFNGLAPVLAPL